MVPQKRPRNPAAPGQQQLRRTILDMLAQGSAKASATDASKTGDKNAVRRVA